MPEQFVQVLMCAMKHLLPILVGDYASFHFLVVLADTDSEPGA